MKLNVDFTELLAAVRQMGADDSLPFQLNLKQEPLPLWSERLEPATSDNNQPASTGAEHTQYEHRFLSGVHHE